MHLPRKIYKKTCTRMFVEAVFLMAIIKTTQEHQQMNALFIQWNITTMKRNKYTSTHKNMDESQKHVE